MRSRRPIPCCAARFAIMARSSVGRWCGSSLASMMYPTIRLTIRSPTRSRQGKSHSGSLAPCPADDATRLWLIAADADLRRADGGRHMKYMLLIYGAEGTLTEEETAGCYQESTDLARDLKSNGQFLATSPLQGVSTATSVQVRGGKRMVTDGPFAETHEPLGGYFLIPGAKWGTVEVRPVVELPDLPTA